MISVSSRSFVELGSFNRGLLGDSAVTLWLVVDSTRIRAAA